MNKTTLDRIKSQIDIVKLIGEFIDLKVDKNTMVGVCPFHKLKRKSKPSLHVEPKLQIFHCFECHQGGDVLTFVKKFNKISFIEAVRLLAERANDPANPEPEPSTDYRPTINDP